MTIELDLVYLDYCTTVRRMENYEKDSASHLWTLVRGTLPNRIFSSALSELCGTPSASNDI